LLGFAVQDEPRFGIDEAPEGERLTMPDPDA
jgi:hypothetical protein